MPRSRHIETLNFAAIPAPKSRVPRSCSTSSTIVWLTSSTRSASVFSTAAFHKLPILVETARRGNAVWLEDDLALQELHLVQRRTVLVRPRLEIRYPGGE